MLKPLIYLVFPLSYLLYLVLSLSYLSFLSVSVCYTQSLRFDASSIGHLSYLSMLVMNPTVLKLLEKHC